MDLDYPVQMNITFNISKYKLEIIFEENNFLIFSCIIQVNNLKFSSSAELTIWKQVIKGIADVVSRKNCDLHFHALDRERNQLEYEALHWQQVRTYANTNWLPWELFL